MIRRVLVALFVLVFACATFAFGQEEKKNKKNQPTERTVSGIVSDASDNPVPGAVVQLKNLKTLEVRSFITQSHGEYFFRGLGTDVDYELKAESNGKTSSTKTLSSFDTRTDATINLKLGK
jgi:hypothetical protein